MADPTPPRDVDGLVTFSELIKGDPRNRRLDPDGLSATLSKIRLSPAAPAVVLHQVRTAKQVVMAGWFFYDLFADATHHVAVACEVALRERFSADLPVPLELVQPKGNGLTPAQRILVAEQRLDADVIFRRLRRKWRISAYPRLDGSFKSLINWLSEAKYVEEDSLIVLGALREWRNISAHGALIITPPPISALQECAWIVNSLFPDAATDEYDRPRKARVREWQAKQTEEPSS